MDEGRSCERISCERGILDLAISRLPGLKPREKVLLCGHFKDEAAFFASSIVDISLLAGRSLGQKGRRPQGMQWDMREIRKLAESDERLARKRGIAFVSCLDPRYPPLLREIFDPPVVLFYRGTLPNPEIPLIGMVGTRHPSAEASSQAYGIAREFGGLGFPVVSGLALGIDAMSHRGNLEGGGATIAVLGSSPDEVYPASNRGLARRIVEAGGALVSEYPPSTLPNKWQFPARNRIICGMSRGTLVVEAPEKSGALITARFALEQDRDIWVASSGIIGEKGAGTAKLAGDGAGVVSSASDILKEWGFAAQKGGEREAEFSPAGLAEELARSLRIG